MAIVQTVFRMNARDIMEFSRTGGRSEILVEAPTTEESDALNDTFDVNAVEVFTHWLDPDKALAALLQALECSFQYSNNTVFVGGAPSPFDCEYNGDGRGWPAQFTHVRNAWWQMAKVFAFLNVRLQSWGIYRRVARHYCGATYAARKPGGVSVWSEGGGDGLLWNDLYSDATRAYGRSPETVSIGTRAGTEDGRPDHPLWITATNTLAVTPFNPASFERRMKNGATQSTPFDWRMSCVHRWSDPDPFVTGYHAYGIPTMHRYWEMFFSPVPGLRFTPGTEPGSGQGSIPSDLFLRGQAASRNEERPFEGDLSLAEYILAIGWKRLIREVRNTVYMNNSLLSALLRGGSFSAELLRQFNEDVDRENSERDSIRRTAAVGTAISEAAGAIQSNPYTAAVATAVGAGTAVARTLALANITPATSPVDTFYQAVIVREGRREAPLIFLSLGVDSAPDALTRVAALSREFNEIREKNSRDFGLPPDEVGMGHLSERINSNGVSPRSRELMRAGNWITPEAERPAPRRGSPLTVVALPDYFLTPGGGGGGGGAGKARPGKVPTQEVLVTGVPGPAPTEPPVDPPVDPPPEEPPVDPPSLLRRAAPYVAGTVGTAVLLGGGVAAFRQWQQRRTP